MKPLTEDKVVLVLSIVLVIITAVALNVRSSEAAYETEFNYGVHSTGDEFNPPCYERIALASFQIPLGGEAPCENGVDPVKQMFPIDEAPEDCPTPQFLAHFLDAPDADTQVCAATTSVISL